MTTKAEIGVMSPLAEECQQNLQRRLPEMASKQPEAERERGRGLSLPHVLGKNQSCLHPDHSPASSLQAVSRALSQVVMLLPQPPQTSTAWQGGVEAVARDRCFLPESSSAPPCPSQLLLRTLEFPPLPLSSR